MTNKKCIIVLIIILGFLLSIDVESINKTNNKQKNIKENDTTLKYSKYNFKD